MKCNESLSFSGRIYGAAAAVRARYGDMKNDPFYNAACLALAQLEQVDLADKAQCIAQGLELSNKMAYAHSAEIVLCQGKIYGSALAVRRTHSNLGNDLFWNVAALALGWLADNYALLAAQCVHDATLITTEAKAQAKSAVA